MFRFSIALYVCTKSHSSVANLSARFLCFRLDIVLSDIQPSVLPVRWINSDWNIIYNCLKGCKYLPEIREDGLKFNDICCAISLTPFPSANIAVARSKNVVIFVKIVTLKNCL